MKPGSEHEYLYMSTRFRDYPGWAVGQWSFSKLTIWTVNYKPSRNVPKHTETLGSVSDNVFEQFQNNFDTAIYWRILCFLEQIIVFSSKPHNRLLSEWSLVTFRSVVFSTESESTWTVRTHTLREKSKLPISRKLEAFQIHCPYGGYAVQQLIHDNLWTAYSYISTHAKTHGNYQTKQQSSNFQKLQWTVLFRVLEVGKSSEVNDE